MYFIGSEKNIAEIIFNTWKIIKAVYIDDLTAL